LVKQLKRSLALILTIIIKITPKSATERTRFRGNIKKKQKSRGWERSRKNKKNKRRKKGGKRRKKREKEE
jgi:hypothetical protein